MSSSLPNTLKKLALIQSVLVERVDGDHVRHQFQGYIRRVDTDRQCFILDDSTGVAVVRYIMLASNARMNIATITQVNAYVRVVGRVRTQRPRGPRGSRTVVIEADSVRLIPFNQNSTNNTNTMNGVSHVESKWKLEATTFEQQERRDRAWAIRLKEMYGVDIATDKVIKGDEGDEDYDQNNNNNDDDDDNETHEGDTREGVIDASASRTDLEDSQRETKQDVQSMDEHGSGEGRRLDGSGMGPRTMQNTYAGSSNDGSGMGSTSYNSNLSTNSYFNSPP